MPHLMPDIEVTNYVMPKNITNPIIIIVSGYNEQNNQGQVAVKGYNPLSWFYPVILLADINTKSIEETEKEHNRLLNKYEEIRNKNKW